MKKSKRLLVLSSASLIVLGSLFTPQNETVANAGVIRHPINEQYYNKQSPSITGNYTQRISLKTKNPQTLHKPYWSGMLKVVNGKLQLESMGDANKNYIFDDNYLIAVLDKDFNVRFKFLTSYKQKNQINDELKDLVTEFNKLGVGLGDYLIIAGQRWNGTVLYDTSGSNSALKRIGYNDFKIGYTNKNVKYSTVLRVGNNGLEEVRRRWGSNAVFANP